MKRALVGALAMCRACPSLGSAGGTRDDPAKATDGSKSYKVKATLLSADLQTMQVTYLDATTGATRSATLSGKAATQVVSIESGASVNLQLRSMSPPDKLLVESIKKRSHKKLVILGLVLATVVVGSAVIVSGGPI